MATLLSKASRGGIQPAMRLWHVSRVGFGTGPTQARAPTSGCSARRAGGLLQDRDVPAYCTTWPGTGEGPAGRAGGFPCGARYCTLTSGAKGVSGCRSW